MKSELAAVLEALEQVPSETLVEAAARMPEPLAATLRRLVDAREAPDPEVSTAAVLEQLTAEPAAVEPLLRGLSRMLAADAGAVSQSAAAVVAAAARASAEGSRLAESLGELDDPVVARMRAALAKVESVPGIVAALARQVDGLSSAVAGVASELRSNLGSVAVDTGKLEERIAALEETDPGAQAQQLSHMVVGVLDELRDLAQEQANASAVRMGWMAATLVEQADGAALPRWRQVLHQADAFDELGVAQDAARRLQLDAIRRNDLAEAREVSSVIAALAIRVNAVRPAVLAVLEDAAMAAKMGSQDEALAGTARAVDVAEDAGDTALLARAWLTRGQVLEGAAQLADARAAYQKVLRLANDHKGFPGEVGQAALHLGRLQLAHQPSQAMRNLELALRVGAAMRDPSVVLRATLAAVPAVADDEEEVMRWLRAARPALEGESQQVLRDGLSEELGRAKVRRWMTELSA